MTHPRPDLVIAEFWEKYFNSDEYKKSKLCMDPTTGDPEILARFHTASLGLDPEIKFEDDVDEWFKRVRLGLDKFESMLPIFKKKKLKSDYYYQMKPHPKTGEWSRLYPDRIEEDCVISAERDLYKND